MVSLRRRPLSDEDYWHGPSGADPHGRHSIHSAFAAAGVSPSDSCGVPLRAETVRSPATARRADAGPALCVLRSGAGSGARPRPPIRGIGSSVVPTRTGRRPQRVAVRGDGSRAACSPGDPLRPGHEPRDGRWHCGAAAEDQRGVVGAKPPRTRRCAWRWVGGAPGDEDRVRVGQLLDADVVRAGAVRGSRGDAVGEDQCRAVGLPDHPRDQLRRGPGSSGRAATGCRVVGIDRRPRSLRACLRRSASGTGRCAVVAGWPGRRGRGGG